MHKELSTRYSVMQRAKDHSSMVSVTAEEFVVLLDMVGAVRRFLDSPISATTIGGLSHALYRYDMENTE